VGLSHPRCDDSRVSPRAAESVSEYAQVYRLQAGERLASLAIRRLRRHRQRELGSAPAVLYVAGSYGVFSLEELLDVLGAVPRESLLPALAKPSSPDSPT
jgi:hypothetical protein